MFYLSLSLLLAVLLLKNFLLLSIFNILRSFWIATLSPTFDLELKLLDFNLVKDDVVEVDNKFLLSKTKRQLNNLFFYYKTYQ
jgi:hypothetical protein